MPQAIETHRTIIIALASAIAFTGVSIFSPPTFAQKVKKGSVDTGKRLQRAVDDIYKNPVVAEQELKRLYSPPAKAYLAFLYLSHKSTFPQSQRKINPLIRQAIAQMPNQSDLANLDATNLPGTSMEKLLIDLRFISEADRSDTVTPPNRMFEQYPKACINAFAAYYFSSQERALPFELNHADDIATIPAVKAVLTDISNINGCENQTTNGTMVYGSYRNQILERLKASLAPQLYSQEMNSAAGKREYKSFSDFIQHWSMQELYNRENYLALQRDTERAIAPLAAHYSKRFHLPATMARNYAEAVLKGYTVSYLGRFCHWQSAEAINMPIYKVFAPHADTIDDLKRKIGQREMTKPELAEALRLQIINGGNLEIIDWLLKSGAPVSGGTESPLFIAVERPEVVAALLKGGADANEANLVGKTALIQAVQYNALATVKELLSEGADINHTMANAEKIHGTDKDLIYSSYQIGGRTTLMYAAAFAESATIDYLVKKGADRKAKDTKGWTPAQFLTWNTRISKADKARLQKELQVH
jgi:hypothetical protein